MATSGSVTLDVYACLFIGNESGHGGAGGNGGAGGDAPTASFSDGRDGGDGGNGWFTGSGAAIYAAGGTVTLRRSTFLENDASFIASNGLGGPGGEGDTIFADDGADGQDGGWAVGPTWAAFHTPTAVVAGCVAWGNTPEDVLLGSATYSDIEVGGLGMTFPGAGNLNTDPFLDAQGWPVSISPCIDAGWDPGLGGDISGNAVLDIGSKPNVGAGATAFADMGAVEYGYPPAAPLANVFVDESNGDPSPDGSFANPYPTIQQGFTAIPANQFLGVISGTYDESVLTFSGKHVTIRALGGVVTIQ